MLKERRQENIKIKLCRVINWKLFSNLSSAIEEGRVYGISPLSGYKKTTDHQKGNSVNTHT